MMPAAIRSRAAKGRVVPDAQKRDKPMVLGPHDPVIMANIAAVVIALQPLTLNTAVLAVLLPAVIAFVVAYVDDSKVMPGGFKPVVLLAAAAPLVVNDLFVVRVLAGVQQALVHEPVTAKVHLLQAQVCP